MITQIIHVDEHSAVLAWKSEESSSGSSRSQTINSITDHISGTWQTWISSSYLRMFTHKSRLLGELESMGLCRLHCQERVMQ